MRALKLQSISPGEEERVARSAAREAVLKATFERGYAEGFAAGAEASADEHSAAQDQLRIQFVEALKDAELSHAEARHDVLRAIYPTIEALIKRMAPVLAEGSAHLEIMEHIERALEHAPAGELVVVCAPDLEQGLKVALENRAVGVQVETDASLTPLEARLKWAEGFDHIDFDQPLKQIEGILARFRNVLMAPDAAEVTDAG